MKKLLLSLVALLLAIPAMAAVTFNSGDVIYLDAGVWETGGAKYSAAFDDSDFASEFGVKEGSYYKFTVPGTGKSYSGVRFVRNTNAATSAGWEPKWNETGKLTRDNSSKNLFTINGWSYGSWSTYTPEVIEIPDGLVYYEGTFSVFVINNKNWSTVNAYVWDKNTDTKYAGAWPGTSMTKLPVKAGSYDCYQWTYTGSLTSASTNIIFNNGNGAQTADLEYVNGGVYAADGTLLGTIEATPVAEPTVAISGTTDVYVGDEATYTASVFDGEGLTVAFYVNGTKQTTGVDGNKFTFTAPEDNYTVQAKLLDGETVKAESDVLNVTVKEHIYVTFTVTVPEGTENVNIAGNFNGWSTEATPMDPQGNNVFTVTIQDIDVETVLYKYVTNQTWDNEEVTAEGGAVANRSYNANDVVAKWKGIDIYYAESLTCEKVYYLDISTDLGEGQTWADGNAWFAAYFFNKNSDAKTWVKGQVAGTSVLFYLATDNVPTRSGEDPVYTHVIFCRMNDAFSTMEWDVYDGETLIEDHVWNQTGDLTYDGTKTNVYNLTGWETAEQLAQIPSAIEGVEVADGITYAYGVVEAEGAIEVYSINGAVVARGNDIVDLRGLNRGIYIVRNGDQVRKVVR